MGSHTVDRMRHFYAVAGCMSECLLNWRATIGVRSVGTWTVDNNEFFSFFFGKLKVPFNCNWSAKGGLFTPHTEECSLRWLNYSFPSEHCSDQVYLPSDVLLKIHCFYDRPVICGTIRNVVLCVTVCFCCFRWCSTRFLMQSQYLRLIWLTNCISMRFSHSIIPTSGCSTF